MKRMIVKQHSHIRRLLYLVLALMALAGTSCLASTAQPTPTSTISDVRNSPATSANQTEACGQINLHQAMWTADAHAVRCHLAAGADPDTRSNIDIKPGDHDGETILVDAVRYGYVEIARALVEAGADVNTMSLTPKFDRKTGTDHTSYEPVQPLIFLIQHLTRSDRHVEIARILLDAGADPNAAIVRPDTDTIYVLEFAANWRDHRIMQLLIDAGADVDTPSDGQTTLLWHAVAWQDAEMVRMLLDAGANPNAVNEYDGSPQCRSPRNEATKR